MLIDAHAHLGTCRVFQADQRPDGLLRAMDAAGVDAAVVQPFPGSPDARSDHDMIAQTAADHPGRLFGLASLNPHTDEAAYRAEIRRCVEDLGFVAVKLHTIGHAVSPGSDDANLVMRTAADLGVPVMIHTGPGVPFAEPAAWIPMARQYPAVTVILAHAGASLYTAPAIVAAQLCENVVLETSWCNPQNIRAAINTLGSEKVLFGSDMLFNIAAELAKYHSIDLTSDELRNVFAASAQRVFRLDQQAGGEDERR